MAVSNGTWYCRDNIRANLNLAKGTDVYCYDLQGLPIEDFSNLHNGAHLLVTKDYFEHPLGFAVGRTLKLQEGEVRGRGW
jgi:hypothetical protein